MGSSTCSPMSGEWPKTLLGSALLLDLCTLWAPGRLPPPAEWKVGSSGSGAQVPGTLATTVLPHRVPHLIHQSALEAFLWGCSVSPEKSPVSCWGDFFLVPVFWELSGESALEKGSHLSF